MRPALAALLVSLAASAAAEPPSRFDVPAAGDRSPDAPPTHEVLLPADVVARPGEDPRAALARALHADEPERERVAEAR
ncbi:MAG TPA: hypothetical protein VIL20_21870 [Sandaracinaceae bacterium]